MRTHQFRITAAALNPRWRAKSKCLSVILLPLLCGLCLIAAAEASGDGATAFTDLSWVDFGTRVVYDECANGGAGENVLISGSILLSSHDTIAENNAGNQVLGSYEGKLTAVGEDSGGVYHGGGAGTLVWTYPPGVLPNTFTDTANFVLTDSSGDVLIMHGLLHVTMDAAGNVTASIDTFTTECP